MLPIQFFVLLFSVFAISRVILRARDKQIKLSQEIFWIVIWVAAIVFAFIPNVTSRISNLIGIGRGMDFIMAISIVVLFYMVFRLYVYHRNVEENLTKLVRKVAIENPKKEKQKKQ